MRFLESNGVVGIGDFHGVRLSGHKSHGFGWRRFDKANKSTGDE